MPIAPENQSESAKQTKLKTKQLNHTICHFRFGKGTLGGNGHGMEGVGIAVWIPGVGQARLFMLLAQPHRKQTKLKALKLEP